MKKIIQTIVITLFFQSTLYAAGIEYQLGVDGVACPFCVYGIEKQLSKLDGIEHLDTDIKKGLVLIVMNEGSTLSEASIREAIKKAGFSLRTLTQNEEMD